MPVANLCALGEHVPSGNVSANRRMATVQVKWDVVWAPLTDGWANGVVLCTSDGRVRNPNGRGVVTRGWSIVQYEGW